MKSLMNTLEWLNANWTAIIIVIGLALALYKKVKNFTSKTTDEKIAIAKAELQKTILKYVAEAENDWIAYRKSGKLKNSDVFKKIYKDYPILTKVIDQESLIKEIDKMITDSLGDLRNIYNETEKGTISLTHDSSRYSKQIYDNDSDISDWNPIIHPKIDIGDDPSKTVEFTYSGTESKVTPESTEV